MAMIETFIIMLHLLKMIINEQHYPIPGQLNEIRRIKLSRLVCDNTDHIESAQVYVMVLPDPKMYVCVPFSKSVLT